MGGTNLKIVLSTAESGHFAIAVSREQKRSVVSLEERVRRKLILAGILPKLFDLGQGAIGKAIEVTGAGQ